MRDGAGRIDRDSWNGTSGASGRAKFLSSPSRREGCSIRSKSTVILLLLIAGVTGYYLLIYRPGHRAPVEIAYVLAKSVEVWDSPAEVHILVDRLKHGDRLEVLELTRNWAKVRTAGGSSGWVERKNLLDAETYEAGQRLLHRLQEYPAQAAGHTVNAVSLRLEPSRGAPVLAQLEDRQPVEVFDRRLLEQTAQPRRSAPSSGPNTAGEAPVSGSSGREAWYLVRAGSEAGWAIGRLVELDVPATIGEYAQGVNLVAWLELNRVEDDGRQVPQYLLADRIGTQEMDFNHIRVLTWGARDQRYATAYVESNLQGYFPIRVVSMNKVPHFRLRLVARSGRKIQKVYGLFGTLARAVGTVDGWESDAMPEQPVIKRRRFRRG